MTTSIGDNSTGTVTSWDVQTLYDQRKRDLLATALKAIGGSLINPFYKETWYGNVNGQVICYSMSRLEIVQNFGRAFFDKLLNKNALTHPIRETPPHEELKASTEENPLDYLLPLLDSSPDSTHQQTPLCSDDTSPFYLSDFYSSDIEGAKDSPKQVPIEENNLDLYYLMMGCPQETSSNQRIAPSDEDIVNAFGYLAKISQEEALGPVASKNTKKSEDFDFLELLSL